MDREKVFVKGLGFGRARAKNLVGGLGEVLSHALEQGLNHIFLVAFLVEFGHIDPVMPARERYGGLSS